MLSLMNQVGIRDNNITDSVKIMKNERYVISGLSSGGVHILDYENPEKPTTVSSS